MLVWKGKIIEKLNTECTHGDYVCEFACREIKFRLRVCAQLFVERNGDDVAIPMEFKSGDKVYTPATQVTPISVPLGE
jgi:hypothetical protein